MRRIYPGLGVAPGDVFWVSPDAPAKELEEASELNHIKKLSEMDTETQSDIAALTYRMDDLPCNNSAGTLKCEGCRGGCQLYSSLPHDGIANERTHWTLPKAKAEQDSESVTDVIAYRSHAGALYASVRKSEKAGEWGEWSGFGLTDVPNDDSNINAGPLPDGRTYLVANGAPHTVRDPLTVALSTDGLNFSTCYAIQTCHDLLPNRLVVHQHANVCVPIVCS